KGAMPPKSKETSFMVDAACSIIFLPTLVELVYVSLRTSVFVVIYCYISRLLDVVSTCKSPLVNTVTSISFASATSVNGVCEAGFSIMEQPATNAGAGFRVTIANGKFQGVIAATTPSLCFMVTNRFVFFKLGMVYP